MNNEWSNIQPYQDFKKKELGWTAAANVAQLGIILSDV